MGLSNRIYRKIRKNSRNKKKVPDPLQVKDLELLYRIYVETEFGVEASCFNHNSQLIVHLFLHRNNRLFKTILLLNVLQLALYLLFHIMFLGKPDIERIDTYQ